MIAVLLIFLIPVAVGAAWAMLDTWLTNHNEDYRTWRERDYQG